MLPLPTRDKLGRPIYRRAVEVRFFEYVTEKGECWLWIGDKDGRGYGRFAQGSMADGTRRQVRAHRWSYEYLVGEVPEGLELDHLCRERLCVNPAHLEPVTHIENVRRGDAGRHSGNRTGWCRRKLHRMDDSAQVRPNGTRYCRECARLRLRERAA